VTPTGTRWTRRQALALGGAFGMGLTLPWMQSDTDTTDLAADVRIYETTTAHNVFPDECDARLQRLYIAEGLQLAIAVQFSRDLSDAEAAQVSWSVSNGAAQPTSGDFSGQSNPALITTTTVGVPGRGPTEAVVRVTYQDVDLVPPLPLRVVSDAEFNAAYSVLSSFVNGSDRNETAQLPLTADLLARFLGQDSRAAGSPRVGTYQLSICDPRLTHRAGADWGTESVANVPMVQYGPDQPASEAVAEGVAIALLAEHAAEIRAYFASHPDATTYAVDYTFSGGLTLDRPLDANLALHSVQFDGGVLASVSAPTAGERGLTAQYVAVSGTVADLYDFDIEASGVGAMPAIEAAKVQIASVKHHIGKVFVVSINVDNTIDSVVFDPTSAQDVPSGFHGRRSARGLDLHRLGTQDG
jgi:hypothetical protein